MSNMIEEEIAGRSSYGIKYFIVKEMKTSNLSNDAQALQRHYESQSKAKPKGFNPAQQEASDKYSKDSEVKPKVEKPDENTRNYSSNEGKHISGEQYENEIENPITHDVLTGEADKKYEEYGSAGNTKIKPYTAFGDKDQLAPIHDESKRTSTQKNPAIVKLGGKVFKNPAKRIGSGSDPYGKRPPKEENVSDKGHKTGLGKDKKAAYMNPLNVIFRNNLVIKGYDPLEVRLLMIERNLGGGRSDLEGWFDKRNTVYDPTTGRMVKNTKKDQWIHNPEYNKRLTANEGAGGKGGSKQETDTQSALNFQKELIEGANGKDKDGNANSSKTIVGTEAGTPPKRKARGSRELTPEQVERTQNPESSKEKKKKPAFSTSFPIDNREYASGRTSNNA